MQTCSRPRRTRTATIGRIATRNESPRLSPTGVKSCRNIQFPSPTVDLEFWATVSTRVRIVLIYRNRSIGQDLGPTAQIQSKGSEATSMGAFWEWPNDLSVLRSSVAAWPWAHDFGKPLKYCSRHGQSGAAASAVDACQPIMGRSRRSLSVTTEGGFENHS